MQKSCCRFQLLYWPFFIFIDTYNQGKLDQPKLLGYKTAVCKKGAGGKAAWESCPLPSTEGRQIENTNVLKNIEGRQIEKINILENIEEGQIEIINELKKLIKISSCGNINIS